MRNLDKLLEQTKNDNLIRPVLKVGLDVHLGDIVIVTQRDGSKLTGARKMDQIELLLFLAKKVQAGYEVHCVYEACGLGFTLYREIEGLGVQCYVIHPVLLNDKNKRRKNDKLDARELCSKLDRYEM